MATLIELQAPVSAYVKYKGIVHIVVGMNETYTLFQILNPLAGNTKLMVQPAKLQPMNCSATCVEHNGHSYLVTKKGTIISYATGRVMNWGNKNGNRIAILGALSQCGI